MDIAQVNKLLLSADIAEGDLVAGKYRVEKVLGVGGMGVVVQAMQVDLDRQVALKFLIDKQLRSDKKGVGRFLREAKAAAKLRSEHAAGVYEIGTLDNGLPYIAMEYLQGQDLAEVLDQDGPLDIRQAVDHILQACEALAEAHSLGIVHRDLKPDNLFLTTRTDGSHCTKILDFGVSKLASTSSEGASLTGTNAILGSPVYMSPEQWEAAKYADARSDIWALGAILYELLCGVVAFSGDGLPAICRAILNDPPKSPREHRAEMPARLEAVILKCLQKDPDNRYQNVAELAIELIEFGPKYARLSARRIVRVLDGAGILARPLTIPGDSEHPAAPKRTEASPDPTNETVDLAAAKTIALAEPKLRQGEAPSKAQPIAVDRADQTAPIVSGPADSSRALTRQMTRDDERLAAVAASVDTEGPTERVVLADHDPTPAPTRQQADHSTLDAFSTTPGLPRSRTKLVAAVVVIAGLVAVTAFFLFGGATETVPSAARGDSTVSAKPTTKPSLTATADLGDSTIVASATASISTTVTASSHPAASGTTTTPWPRTTTPPIVTTPPPPPAASTPPVVTTIPAKTAKPTATPSPTPAKPCDPTEPGCKE